MIFNFLYLKDIYFKEFEFVIDNTSVEFIYYVIFIFNLVLFYFFTERMRTYRNVIIIGIAPPIFIFILELMSTHYKIVFITAGLFMIYFIYTSLLVIHKVISDRNKGKNRISKWIYLGGKNIRQVTHFLCLLLFFTFISIKIWDAKQTINLSAHIESVKNVEGDLWENNKDRLLLLKEENYTSLSESEKATALQGIIDLEMVYNGIDGVNLCVKNLEDEDLGGYYTEENRVITINRNVLDMAPDIAIQVVLHEFYHAYQYACISSIDWDNVNTDIRLYKDILQWKEDFEAYNDADGTSEVDEYLDYYNQSCECDAREYAEEWSYWYMTFIEGIETDGEEVHDMTLDVEKEDKVDIVVDTLMDAIIDE